VNTWINVEDELPPISHEELVMWNGKWSRVGKYLDTLYAGPQFHTYYDTPEYGITLWMRIPNILGEK